MALNLLLADDDEALAAMLADGLAAAGHRVTLAADGRAALGALASDQFDAVILERRMPRLDGLALLRKMRDDGMTLPVIMLTALAEPSDTVEGLEAGADDYLAKPITAAELNARLAAILRGRRWHAPGSETLRVRDIVVNPGGFRAWRAGNTIDLGRIELNLLIELARNADTVLTRAMLVERVWGYDSDARSNVVEVYIRRLRTKLMDAGGDDPILTVRGIGYMLRG